MNTEKLRALIAKKRGRVPSVVNLIKENLNEYEFHPDVLDYIERCLPDETYLASGVRVLPMTAIEMEMGEASAPGCFIRPYGYIIIASTIGGNVVCVHAATGRVFFAGHDNYTAVEIMRRNRDTGGFEFMDHYSETSVEAAMILIETDFERFITELVSNRLDVFLDGLDSAV